MKAFYCAILLLILSVTTALGTHYAANTQNQQAILRVGTQSESSPAQSLLTTTRHFPQSVRSQSVRLTTTLIGGQMETDETANVTTSSRSEKEFEFIKESLLENVMFTNLPDSTLEQLIDAFEKVEYTKDEVIVYQGDGCEEDYVYLVADGVCTVIVDGKVVPEPYGALHSKNIFGEMAFLYNQTRAATISAKSDQVTLFRVNGDIFKKILNRLAIDDDPELLEKIDQAINQVSGTKSLYGGDIIRQYRPNRMWLWRQWSGTVLQHNYRTTLLNMALSLVFVIVTRRLTDPAWNIGLAPDKSHPFIQRLAIIQKLWSYQSALTTFILTFFVNQAYSFWQMVHGIARGIQGRLNDFNILLATNAQRNPDGTYTRESEKLLEDVSSFSRLFHALFWASCAKRFRVLRTPKGLERMASRGLMTSRQLQVLESLDLPNNQKHNACVEWMMVRAFQGLEDGTLKGGDALYQRLMDQGCQLRGTYASVMDRVSTRMPLAYTHFVQILVDSFIILAPAALYADLGAYSVICVGILTLFYTGLLDLAKIFLDPLDNEGFTKNSIYMDLGVLIRESNAGSTRWKNAGARLPFATPPPGSKKRNNFFQTEDMTMFSSPNNNRKSNPPSTSYGAGAA